MKAAAVIAALALGALFLGSREPPPAAPGPQAAPRVSLSRPAAIESKPVPLPVPRSLEGTRPDGAALADAQGALVLDADLRLYLDYFLTAEKELSPAALRAVILSNAGLPEKARDQLGGLLDRYLAYRAAGRALEKSPDAATLQALRTRMLGDAAAQALFSEPDAVPPPADPLRLDEEEAAMRAAGATDDEVSAVRTQASGPEAAARLDALDRTRREWQARLDEFDRRRAGRDDAQATRALLDELFSAPERRRVRALRSLPPD